MTTGIHTVVVLALATAASPRLAPALAGFTGPLDGLPPGPPAVADEGRQACQGRQGRAGRAARRERDELARELRAERPETRRSAVRALARIGDRDAWRLVMGALSDPASMVGDAAQRALAGIDDEQVLSDLLGREGLRSQEDVVRSRAAEALGRLEIAVDAERLCAGLTGSDEGARMALWSLERLAR